MEPLALTEPKTDADESQKAESSHLDWSNHTHCWRVLLIVSSFLELRRSNDVSSVRCQISKGIQICCRDAWANQHDL